MVASKGPQDLCTCCFLCLQTNKWFISSDKGPWDPAASIFISPPATVSNVGPWCGGGKWNEDQGEMSETERIV